MLNQDFLTKNAVSRETISKLEIYAALLKKWQRAVNLVGPKTLGDVWARHFADSLQLLRYIDPSVRCVVDLGSGAGFPGLVLAIARPDLDVVLIESDQKKCQFLKAVSRETISPVEVCDGRIEDVADRFQPDLVTARALAPLQDLCGYCDMWARQNSALEALFLKGEQAAQEIQNARQSYDFDLTQYNSDINAGGCVLHVKALRSV